MNKVQHEAIEEGFLDLLGTDKSKVQEVKMNDLENTLEQLAAMYILMLQESADKKDVSSSGKIQDSITATDVEMNGSVYSVGINAPEYASYQDEGVNGWAVNRGSRFQFRTKGVDPNGAMLKSVSDWIQREGKSARTVKVAVTSREARGMDILKQRAITAAYMIKRQGIKATHFWSDATKDFQKLISDEIGKAIEVDIINNLYK